MSVPVTDAIGRGWERMAKICFQPFDLAKWLGLGFCSFLAGLGQGGFRLQLPTQNLPGPGGGQAQSIEDWISNNVDLVVGLGVLIGIVVIGLMLLVLWLGSRGKFMLLDGVVHDRGLVKQPWYEFRELGNSLFGFRAVLGIALFVVVVGTLAVVGVAVIPPLTQGQRLSSAAIGVIVAGVGGLLLVALAGSIISFILHDFAVPVMYARRLRVREAWSVATEAVLAELGSVILYFVLKILLGFGAALVAMLAILVTCCLGALPYVSSVLLLPVAVFLLGFNLYFVQMLGPAFDVFATTADVDAFA